MRRRARGAHRADAIVATGTRGSQPVIVTLLTTNDPYWVDRRDHKRPNYARLAASRPPRRFPTCTSRPTVLMRLGGQRLGDERHLTGELAPSTIDAGA